MELSAPLLLLAPSHGEEMLELGPPPLLVLNAGRQVAIVGEEGERRCRKKEGNQ
jgi:hypothetical protein